MGLGPSLNLKPVEDRAVIASKCPVSACRDEAVSRYAALPTEAGVALAAGLVTVHTAVTSAGGLSQLKQLPPHWLDVVADIMLRVHQQRSGIAVDLAHRLQESHQEFRCTGVSPSRAFPRYWSCGVVIDNYLSLALGEMPPRFHLHMDHVKLQDVGPAFTDVVTSHFPELMNKNRRCILKTFLKLANEVLNTIAVGEEIGKDDVAVQVTEDDEEFPPVKKTVIWFSPISNKCGGRTVGSCPHVFCQYNARRPHHNF